MTNPRPSHVQHPGKLFIGGEWVEPSANSTFDVRDSATEEVFLTISEAQAPDIERAIAAARAAFKTSRACVQLPIAANAARRVLNATILGDTPDAHM